MNPLQIAQAIVDGKLRPRVAEVKRLAEALLGKLAPENAAKAPKKSAAKKDKAKKADSKKAARKLAKIPGQKKKKK